jgi:hypothetical protein
MGPATVTADPLTRKHGCKRRGLRLLSAIFTITFIAATGRGYAQQASAPAPQAGTIVGTVTDVRDDVVPDATVVLQGADARDQRTATTNDNGFFSFANVKAGVPYHINISGKGFANWSSPAITLTPGQYLELPSVRLQVAVVIQSVTTALTQEQIATQQVEIEEKQRVLGIIPNFYVVYDERPAPLTPKLKFRLAARLLIDPMTFIGSSFVAATEQAASGTPDYGQGWDAYGQRVGANYADGVTDIMFGDAILPSLLHQDPRYYYKGTGTIKSRIAYALANPFRRKADNGEWQPNWSSWGGYLVSGALSNVYYPESDRGAKLLGQSFAVGVGAAAANGVIQEFVLRHLTPSAKNQP